MASKDLETIRAVFESWNNRDFEGAIRNMVENFSFTDHAHNITMNTRAEFQEWSKGWVKAMSAARITNPRYTDAGDVVIAEFTGVGTNDGSFAGLAPTGKRVSADFCEVFRFDKQGRIVSGGAYYDLYTMLVQLGHVRPLATAA